MLRRLLPLLTPALLGAPLDAQVGLASSARAIVLTAAKAGSVRVGLPSGGGATLSVVLGAGRNEFDPLPIETAWDLDPSRSSAVALVAYFASPNAALAGDGAAIPSSSVSARVARDAEFVTFAGPAVAGGGRTAGVAGGTLVLFSQPVSPDAAAGTRIDQLQMMIDCTGLPHLPAGHYRGTLNLLAITQ